MSASQPGQKVPAPRVGLDDAFFWEGIAAGVLRLERCGGCERLRQPSGPMCPACGSLELEIFEPAPHGRLLSWFLSHHPPAAVPEQRIVALVELVCGARLVVNLREVEQEELRLHLPVDVFVDTLDGIALPQARPAALPEDTQ
ncbi:Zn-ribbon domain-containing OB-fold protein [Yinghuangia sp. YIM S09857]|uniref:Zn-ribbon domain-containing OB-fold protein n=1 Tax=Yinghuangia sp. YIM S09857 TaxID=3436929 RepID=UPI003F534E5C